MRRTVIDNTMEKEILTGLIVSKEFLAQALPFIHIREIDDRMFRLVGKWCLDYFQKYNKAPRTHIRSIFQSWSEEGRREPDEVETIQNFLENLSEIHDKKRKINVPYLMDELAKFLNKKRLEQLQEQIEVQLHSGKLNEAVSAVSSFKGVEINASQGIDPLNTETEWAKAFQQPPEPLITFPDPANNFFRHAFVRDALIAIQGPEKRGKTWWCIEFIMRALRDKRKVAFFQTGDLSQSQVMVRLGVRLTGRPLWKDLCGKIKIPKRLEVFEGTDEHEKKEVHPKFHVRTVDKTVSQFACEHAAIRFMRSCGIPERVPFLKVSTHPNSTVNVQQIDGIIEQWKLTEGFIPDIIVIDYADILAPEDPKKDARQQVNDTWKALRRLSQERHCLVISPTQSSREGYGANLQEMKHATEDKRKLSHVTGMIGLNQTDDEKDNQIMRLNWVVLREAPFNTKRCLWVGQCLSIGRAYCCGEF